MASHFREPREPPWVQDEFENPWHDPRGDRRGYERQGGVQNREHYGQN